MCSSRTELVDDAFQPVGADIDRRRIELADGIANGAHRARAAHRLIPTAAPERGLVGLDGRRAATRARCIRFCESWPSAKNSSLSAHAADLQALQLQRLEASPMMISVLPPPMSQTRRRPGPAGMCAKRPNR